MLMEIAHHFYRWQTICYRTNHFDLNVNADCAISSIDSAIATSPIDRCNMSSRQLLALAGSLNDCGHHAHVGSLHAIAAYKLFMTM